MFNLNSIMYLNVLNLQKSGKLDWYLLKVKSSESHKKRHIENAGFVCFVWLKEQDQWEKCFIYSFDIEKIIF